MRDDDWDPMDDEIVWDDDGLRVERNGVVLAREGPGGEILPGDAAANEPTGRLGDMPPPRYVGKLSPEEMHASASTIVRMGSDANRYCTFCGEVIPRDRDRCLDCHPGDEEGG